MSIKAIIPEHEGGAAVQTVADFTGCLEQGEFRWWTASATGIAFKDETPAEAWRTQTQNLVLMYQALDSRRAQAAMKVGDALNWGREHLGEEWSQVIDATSKELVKSLSTLGNWMDIARMIPPSRRRETLTTIEHYKAVTKLDADEQVEFLKLADEENLTVNELKQAIRTRHPLPAKKTKPRAIVSIETGNPAAVTDALQILANHLSNPETEILEDWKEHLAALHKVYRRKWQNGHKKGDQ